MLRKVATLNVDVRYDLDLAELFASVGLTLDPRRSRLEAYRTFGGHALTLPPRDPVPQGDYEALMEQMAEGWLQPKSMDHPSCKDYVVGLSASGGRACCYPTRYVDRALQKRKVVLLNPRYSVGDPCRDFGIDDGIMWEMKKLGLKPASFYEHISAVRALPTSIVAAQLVPFAHFVNVGKRSCVGLTLVNEHGQLWISEGGVGAEHWEYAMYTAVAME